MDHELTKYMIKRFCHGRETHEDGKSPIDPRNAFNKVDVMIPYSFLDDEHEISSLHSNTVTNASNKADGSYAAKSRRSSGCGSQEKTNSPSPEQNICKIMKKRTKNRLCCSTPEDEENFKKDLKGSFLDGITRLRSSEINENPNKLDISISCVHTEDWINVSKMGYFTSCEVQQIITEFLHEKCGFTGKSHLNIIESLRQLGLTDGEIYNNVVVISPSNSFWRYSGVLEFNEPSYSQHVPKSYRSGSKEIIGQLCYGEFLHGSTGARRSFYRAAIEKLDLVDSQLSPELEPLPRLGEFDFSQERICAKFKKNDVIISIDFSCPSGSEMYGKPEKLPMFSVLVTSIQEIRPETFHEEESIKKMNKDDIEIVVALENSKKDLMKE